MRAQYVLALDVADLRMRARGAYRWIQVRTVIATATNGRNSDVSSRLGVNAYLELIPSDSDESAGAQEKWRTRTRPSGTLHTESTLNDTPSVTFTCAFFVTTGLRH